MAFELKNRASWAARSQVRALFEPSGPKSSAYNFHFRMQPTESQIHSFLYALFQAGRDGSETTASECAPKAENRSTDISRFTIWKSAKDLSDCAFPEMSLRVVWPISSDSSVVCQLVSRLWLLLLQEDLTYEYLLGVLLRATGRGNWRASFEKLAIPVG
jgi:hypothetical protein